MPPTRLDCWKGWLEGVRRLGWGLARLTAVAAAAAATVAPRVPGAAQPRRPPVWARQHCTGSGILSGYCMRARPSAVSWLQGTRRRANCLQQGTRAAPLASSYAAARSASTGTPAPARRAVSGEKPEKEAAELALGGVVAVCEDARVWLRRSAAARGPSASPSPGLEGRDMSAQDRAVELLAERWRWL